MNWSVGHNMPGYLPESDVFITADFESARGVLLEDLERAADAYADVVDLEPGNDPEVDAYAGAEEAIAELKTHPADEPFLAYVDGIAYWIDQTDEPTEDGEPTGDDYRPVLMSDKSTGDDYRPILMGVRVA